MSEQWTRGDLLRAVRKFPEHLPISDKLAWPRSYRSHRAHWIGWLEEYDGEGYYGRQNWDRNARFIYNHIENHPMLIWLGEAAGLGEAVHRAVRATRISRHPAAQAAAVRRVVPWVTVADLVF